MLSYDRRILLPYLHDVYCMELLAVLQQKEYRHLQTKLKEMEDNLEEDLEPEAQSLASSKTAVFLGMSAALLCLCSIFTGIMAVGISGSFGIMSVLFFLSALGCVGLLVTKLREYRRSRQGYDQYCMEIMDYNNRAPEREKLKRGIAHCHKHLNLLTDRISQVHGLRSSLYGANVIPGHFRSLEAVQFLYEHFSTSKADNLDLVLQLFALENMNGNLKPVTARQASVVLRQRTALARQEARDPIYRQDYEEKLGKLAAMEADGELRSLYLRLIQEHQQVTDYFIQLQMDGE